MSPRKSSTGDEYHIRPKLKGQEPQGCDYCTLGIDSYLYQAEGRFIINSK